MPPKLQVEESLAFLFTCIEVSGIKVSNLQVQMHSDISIISFQDCYID